MTPRLASRNAALHQIQFALRPGCWCKLLSSLARICHAFAIRISPSDKLWAREQIHITPYKTKKNDVRRVLSCDFNTIVTAALIDQELISAAVSLHDSRKSQKQSFAWRAQEPVNFAKSLALLVVDSVGTHPGVICASVERNVGSSLCYGLGSSATTSPTVTPRSTSISISDLSRTTCRSAGSPAFRL